MSMKKFNWLASTALAGGTGLSVGLTRLGAGAALAALALAAAPAAYAQETSAAIHGNITSGGLPAAIAAVTILHAPSGTRQQTSTNNEGAFVDGDFPDDGEEIFAGDLPTMLRDSLRLLGLSAEVCP